MAQRNGFRIPGVQNACGDLLPCYGRTLSQFNEAAPVPNGGESPAKQAFRRNRVFPPISAHNI